MEKILRSKIGEIGEDIAVRFLSERRGHTILNRRYRKKWGEVDIISKKGDVLHFVEVKTVTRENIESLENSDFRAEENIHPWKIKRLERTILSYLLANKIEEDIEWQMDAVIVNYDVIRKRAKIEYIECIY